MNTTAGSTDGGYSRGDRGAIAVAGVAFVVCLLGNLWLLRDARGQALQDKLAGAVVSAEREPSASLRSPAAGIPRGPSPA